MRVEASLMSHPFHEEPEYPGIEGIAEAARKVEALGFDGILVPEAGGHDPFFPVLVAAEHTSRVSIRTGIAVAFPRSPLVTAQMAWDLQRFSGGRFELGLGTQVKGQNERRYASPWTAAPGPRLREYVLCLKAMFQTFQDGGKPSEFQGEHYSFSLMPPVFNPGPIEHPKVPVFVAAVNRYMSRVAGELCDGIFPHPVCTPRYMRETVLPAIEKGAAKAGRQASDVEVLISPMMVTGRTREEIERVKPFVKQRLGFYASTRSYHAPMELHGHLEVGQELFRLSMEGKWGEMAGLVSDAMLADFATVATWDELGAALKERWGDVATVMHLDLPSDLREDEGALRGLIEALR